MNAGELSPELARRMMRHKTYTTTMKYIDMARQAKLAIDNLFVPRVEWVSQGGVELRGGIEVESMETN
jgi:hypothetical protein